MCIDANTYKKVITEQREDNTFRNLWGNIEALADYFDVVIEEHKTARRMVHRSTAGEIDDKILKKKPSSLSNAFILADLDYYSNIREIFHILLTMPIRSVPCERSFSASSL